MSNIFNTTDGMREDKNDLDYVCDDEEVECYNERNDFCTLYGQRCPFTNGEKLDCEMFEEKR